jgi:S-adenosyl-L-methionine hydrolase (adenosine-forming)
MNVITLTTDFGYRDEYVGVIKAVMLKIHPGVTIVDITHEIPAQAVAQAGETLKAAFAWFPEGTVHVAVVDPEVGSARAIIAARFAGHHFIAPDNGLLPIVWGRQRPQRIVHVQKSEFFLHPVSATFHGRDILSPVAAHLAMGIALDELGPVVDLTQIRHLSPDVPVWKNDLELQGHVTYCDHFGNLRTNIDREDIRKLTQRCRGGTLMITLGEHRISGLVDTYAQHENGRIIALINSRNQLEIAVVGGSAAEGLKNFQGMALRVTLLPADGS